jgi:dihydrofolate synthase/folylpolyglutamate synthase
LGLPDPVELSDLLEPFSRRGIDLALGRLEAALAEAGHPERQFVAVQVAGTNGKGSICTFLGAILQAAGLRCAIYRSPHLVSWCERLELNGQWISGPDLRRAVASWQQWGERHRLTPFELLTGAAFSHCAGAAIDLAVLEVGLGGRLDATTTHPDRRVLGMASIGLDHCEHLGSSLGAIAAEKAGVFQPGAVAISGPQLPEVAAVLAREAQARGTQLRWVEPLGSDQPLGLAGQWQRTNGAVALAMAEALRGQGWPIPAAAINQGLAEARWPGRLELCRWQGQELLVDGAHNPPAAAALRQELDHISSSTKGAPGPRRWLLGIQRHKQGPEMLASLLGPADQAWIVAIPGHPSWSAAELGAALPGLAGQLSVGPSLEEGLAQLMALKWRPLSLPLVAGSLYLLGALQPLLERPDCR